MPQRRGNFKVSKSEGQVVQALGSIGAATLLSRVLGFVRDMVVARTFGAGPVTDAFFVAFRIPNILRRLLAEGALSTAMIPVFTEYAATRSRPELRRMLRAVLGLALIALTVTTVLGIVAAPWILRVIALGFMADPGKAALAVMLTQVMFPYLPLVGLAAMATGVLNSQGRFFAGAIGPAVLNVGMIAAVALLARHLEPPILSLALGVLFGGIGQLLVQVPGLRACDLLVKPSTELGHPAIGRVTRLLLPSVFGLAAVQVMVFVNTLLASFLSEGSISYLYYADRVMEFPLGVFGIALASASLPVMARQAAAQDRGGLAGTLNFALRLGVYVSVPATIGLVALRAPIVRLLTTPGIVLPGAQAAPHPVHLVQLALRLGMTLLHESLPYETHVVCGFSRGPDHTHVLVLRQRPCRDCDRRSRDKEHATRRGVASLLRPAFRLVAHGAACNSYREGFALASRFFHGGDADDLGTSLAGRSERDRRRCCIPGRRSRR